MIKRLTIRVAGPGSAQRVTVDILIKTLEETLIILHSLAQRLSSEELEWEIVRIRMKSPLSITLAPRENGARKIRQTGARVVKAYFDGMRTIQKKPQVPTYFDEPALSAAKEIAELSAKGTRIRFEAPKEEPVEPTEQTVANIDEVISKGKVFFDMATFEGKLETISIHDHAHFVIWETLTNSQVKCLVPPDRLPLAWSLLGKRVAVYGRVRYNRLGRPVSIDVEDIRSLKDISELPQPKDIGKVDITGGMSSEDFVRRMRDAR